MSPAPNGWAENAPKPCCWHTYDHLCVRHPGISWFLEIADGKMWPCLCIQQQWWENRRLSPAVHNLLRSAADGPENLEADFYQVIKESIGNRLYLSLKASFFICTSGLFPQSLQQPGSNFGYVTIFYWDGHQEHEIDNKFLDVGISNKLLFESNSSNSE